MNIYNHMHNCCAKHGCKYGDHDCPVADGSSPQKYTCELCNDESIAKDTFSKMGIGTLDLTDKIICGMCNKVKEENGKDKYCMECRHAYDHGIEKGKEQAQVEIDRLFSLFKRISGLGRVCDDFENCEHTACDDSCLAKMIADEALKGKQDR